MLRPRSMLRDYQVYLADQIRSREAIMLVVGMGYGKSAAALTAAADMLRSGEVTHILVVAPLRVARDTWPEEIETWEHTAGIDYAVAVGDERERRAALAKKARITIVNRENLTWLWKALRDGADWFFDMLVVDESSMFKEGRKRTAKVKRKNAAGEVKVSPGGNITGFKVLANARKSAHRIVLLTGTPAPNGLHDLWGQIYLLDRGDALGYTKDAFLKRWFIQDKYSYKIEPREGVRKEIMGRIGDLMISLPPLDLVPPPVFIPVKVRLPDEAMREYRRFERTLISEAHDVEAVSRGVLTNKLLQFANGSMYREDRSISPVHDEKLKALDDLVERAGDENLLVFYGFQFDLEQIRARYPHAVVLNEDPTAVKRWNAGEIKMLLAHPASCAHGLNLQYGGHIAIWYGLTWSLELYLQANARLPRPGQKDLVAIYQIIAEDTVDEKVLAALAGKESTQESVTSAVLVHLGVSENHDEVCLEKRLLAWTIAA